MIELDERIMILDSETTNSLDDPACYDVGYRIFDLGGNVYEEASLVNRDVFCDKEMMASAFYADKIPQYWRDIWDKKRELLTWREIKWRVWDACLRNNVKYVVAHNARFDRGCLEAAFEIYGMGSPRYEWYDTLQASRRAFGRRLPNHQLQTVAAACGYDMRHHHHALADAEACARIAIALEQYLVRR